MWGMKLIGEIVAPSPEALAPLCRLAPLCVKTMSLLWEPSCPTSTTCTCCKGALHFMVYLGPTGTRLLISGDPLVEMRRRAISFPDIGGDGEDMAVRIRLISRVPNQNHTAGCAEELIAIHVFL